MADPPYGKSFAKLDVYGIPKGWLPDDLSSDGDSFTITHNGISMSAKWATRPNGEFDEDESYNRFRALKEALWSESERNAMKSS